MVARLAAAVRNFAGDIICRVKARCHVAGKLRAGVTRRLASVSLVALPARDAVLYSRDDGDDDAST